jgi:Lysylphosphatidylglycerol synthase TM region
VAGIGLRTGLFPGRSPWTLTVAPAILGAAVIALLCMRALPNDFERRITPLAGAGRGRRLLARVASAPWAAHDALAIAFSLIKEGKLWLIGTIAYWTFDIATLWACFHAFGSPPTVAVIVMAYFVGTLANSLPLPGGLGGVEAGMSAPSSRSASTPASRSSPSSPTASSPSGCQRSQARRHTSASVAPSASGETTQKNASPQPVWSVSSDSSR